MNQARSYKDIFTQEINRITQHVVISEKSKTILLGISDLTDKILLEIWNDLVDDKYISLIAVGGYGRQELHPYSDIDLLILLTKKETESQQKKISQFITFLWDIGLKIGHSVRTIKECVAESKKDVITYTNLLESRVLSDPICLLPKLKLEFSNNNIWSKESFFAAKLAEQDSRHNRFNDTEYNLEPNIKQSPGGLRDIQTIVWLLLNSYNSMSLDHLVHLDILNHHELESLLKSRNKLWDIRLALHLICGRGEDRLLFDYQPQLAEYFLYSGDTINQKVEGFMHDYYRTVRNLAILNDLVLQAFAESFEKQISVKKLDDDFNLINGKLSLRNSFTDKPQNLLLLFIKVAGDPKIKGIRAKTIRNVYDNLYLIDDNYINNSNHKEIFINMFSQPGLTTSLRLMHRYGVLSKYLPIFAEITGLMQYDLFHAFTVDEHILFVVRNLRRLAILKYQGEHPFLSRLINDLQNPECLFIAGFFHDIAKGQKGNHSKVGSKLAEDFCAAHSMPPDKIEHVMWLVENHLIMSSTIQRKDIYDQRVVLEFATAVNSLPRLNMLYLLTVADIKATNIKLWSDWKSGQLYQLYISTEKHIKASLPAINDLDHLKSVQSLALNSLKMYSKRSINTLWKELGDDYFLSKDVSEIVWQTKAILDSHINKPLVSLSSSSYMGASRLLVYTRDRNFLLSDLVSVLESFPIKILEANITTTENNWAIDSFYFLSRDFSPIDDLAMLVELETRIESVLFSDTLVVSKKPRLSRHEKHFISKARINFTFVDDYCEMLVKVSSQPYLLTIITEVLNDFGLILHKAKITSFGNVAEDWFLLKHPHKEINTEMQEQLSSEIVSKLIAK